MKRLRSLWRSVKRGPRVGDLSIAESLCYRWRYARRLQSRGGLGLLEALRYPIDFDPSWMGDPVEDADVEISYWEG